MTEPIRGHQRAVKEACRDGPYRICRVSTTDQDLDIQIGRLKAAGCEIVRSEAGSGASRNGRTELETIMQFLHSGNELIVLRLDRLGVLHAIS